MKRWTLGARLTLIYTVLTAVTGAALLGLTLLLASSVLPEEGVKGQLALGPGHADAASSFPKDTEIVDLRAAVQDSLVRTGAVALLAAAAVAALLGWFMARRALRPVRHITATAQQVADQDLGTRIQMSGPDDEIKELADTFDRMLARLEWSFAGQRRFIANAAHELKTPVAGQRAVAEVAVAHPGAPAETVALGRKFLVSTAHQQRLLDSLLALAQNPGTVAESDVVDLAQLTGEIVRAHPGHGIEVREDFDSAEVRGDPVLLEQLVRNLVDNAFRYNTPEGWLSARTARSADTGECVLEIANTGAPLGQDDATRLFEPFLRLCLDHPSRPPGSGLGLSVVRAIAEAHGGSATARPRDSGGLMVEVHLPAA
ncbi:hypothetical protein GCM10022222_10690 [Amycolatopsis ultiminotia]|uniref:histidine kinase n=1 Tax=Amycolatopsis ultiminotia TaxID=543629 RepID=A0ABP6V748_9PSEU